MLPGILTNPYFRERLMTRLTNEAPGNVAPILPIETAVTGGRSFWAWKRSGFLEFQERFLEEIAVATVWLYGVKSMAKLMDKIIGSLQREGKLRGVNMTADWSKSFMSLFLSQKQAPSILISPLERYSNSFETLLKTLKVKGLKWGIAIAVPLYLCGIAIPKLNQKKTEWIIKRFYANKPHPEGNSGQKAPHFSAQALPATEKSSNSVEMQPQQGAWPSSAPGNWAGGYSPQVRFGISPSKALGTLSTLAHYVDNTAYGSVLVIDAGVTGGRMWSAWPRSPFESIEYGARDAGSLFFYMMSVPLMMKWAGKLLNTPWGSKVTNHFYGGRYGAAVGLDEQAASRVNETLVNALKKSGVSQVTPEAFNTLLNGSSSKALSPAVGVLGEQLRKASSQPFMELLEREMMAFTATPREAESAKRLLEKTRAYFTVKLKVGESISVDQFETFLKALWKKDTAFGALSDAQRFNLNTASKLAFHHQVGLTREGLIKTVLSHASLPKAEEQRLIERLGLSARQGGDKVIASILQRGINAANLTRPLNMDIVNQSKSIMACVEKAVMEGASINTFVEDHLKSVLAEYRTFLQSQGTAVKPNRQLERYVTQIEQALAKGDARLNPKTLETFAQLLEQNGRTGPKALRWLKGPGLAHLAEDVRMVAPLVDEQKPLADTLKRQVEYLMSKLVEATERPASVNQHRLMRHYREQVQALLQGEGRASVMVSQSMPEFKQTLTKQVEGVLRGGLLRGEHLYESVSRVLGRAPEHAEVQKAKAAVEPYLAMVEKRVNRYLTKNSALSVTELTDKILKPLARQNARYRYGAWGVAVTASMLGVGVLIPKLQYWMTKALTGKDTHPGLAAVSSKMGVQS